MAAEDLVTSAPDSPTAATESHKRKLDDLELSNEPVTESEPIADPDSAANNEADGEENGGAADESDVKRPRLETSNGDDTVSQTDAAAAAAEVSQNGHQEEQKADEPDGEAAQQPESVENTSVPSEADEPAKENVELTADEPTKGPVETIVEEKNETTAADDAAEPKEERAEEPSLDQAKTEAEIEISSEELPREGDVPVSLTDLQPGSDIQVLSRKIEVPNDKVGVLIGKAGDTIRSLQDNSGAKIQIVRDADADPRAATRPLELVGTLQSINKAEKLIKDVIAEADAGGAPSLVARGFTTAQAASAGEQIEIQVPYEKVGLIIGKGGESIRNLQTRSGARIQLIQPSPSQGNRSGERTVRITGNKKQIENAREMIKDVMNQIWSFLSLPVRIDFLVYQ